MTSRAEWEVITDTIRIRDLRQAWERSDTLLDFEVWARGNPEPCVASFLGDREYPCFGPLTNEHVQLGYGSMGMKALDCVCQLVTLCQNHHLSLFAGFNWASANKDVTRAYLLAIYGKDPAHAHPSKLDRPGSLRTEGAFRG